MKKILPIVLIVVSVSIYSCQKDHSVAPKATSASLSKKLKDTTPPSFKVFRDTTPPAARFTVQKDTTPPTK